MLLIPGKIPVHAQPVFWVLILLIGWINTMTMAGTLIWAMVILFSVLIHEYGHALTAVAFGQKARIELVGMGGLTQRTGPKIALWKEFAIVFCGPLAGFMLFLGAYALRLRLGGETNTLFLYALDVTTWVNLFWTIVNLLPIQPLDGGHLLRILLEGIFGFRGIKIALFLSLLLSGGIALVFFSIGGILIGALFLMLAFENFRGWQSVRGLTAKDRDGPLQKLFKDAEDEYKSGNPEAAIAKFKKVREISKDGIIYMAATEYLAELLFDRERDEEVLEILSPIQDKLSPNTANIYHQLIYRKGDWKEAIEIGNKAYQSYPNFNTALVNAMCHALLGEIQPAIGWLQTAINEGLPNVMKVMNRADFDRIKESHEFHELMDKYREE